MTLSSRGTALYQPNGPASTSSAAAVEAHTNGLLIDRNDSGYNLRKRRVPSAHSTALSNGHLERLDTSQPPVLVRPDGRRFPLPPGLAPETYELIRDSPFLDLDSPMTAYEWFKFVLFLPAFLGRLLLIAILMPPCWLFSWLIILGEKPNQPLPPWRVALIRPFSRFWALILMWLGMNFYYKVKGKENIEAARKARAMIVINHVSYVDALALGQVFVPCGLAKSSVINVPCFGTFAVMLQFLFVERRNSSDQHTSKSRKGSVTSLIHERSADASFPLFLMMPEGTTKGAGCVLPFSSGAFVFGRPVLPVLMRYKARHFNVGWGCIQSVVWHILRLQAQFINHLTIEILPVYHPSPEEQADPKLYAENVRRYIADKLGVQLSTHGMREHSQLKKARICVDWTGKRIIQRPLKKDARQKAHTITDIANGTKHD